MRVNQEGQVADIYNKEIIPGVTTLALPGHTPGHSGFLFQFGDESFIAAGDFAHDPLLQLARPSKRTSLAA
jgi:glyoxylase-like metal-dependent hydrolase (beta-lactamase superfamily II)